MEPHEIRLDVRRDLLRQELDQCWADVRHNDSILWQIPAAIGAIVGLILNVVVNSHPLSWLHALAVVAAILVTWSLIVTEYKNRIFQVTRNIYRASIYNELLRIARMGPDELVVPTLQIDDFKGLVGFVETATDTIPAPARKAAFKAAGFYRQAGWVQDRLKAYKTLLVISLLLLAGEIVLLGVVIERLAAT
jgi:hypothetical protein